MRPDLEMSHHICIPGRRPRTEGGREGDLDEFAVDGLHGDIFPPPSDLKPTLKPLNAMLRLRTFGLER